MEKLKHVMNIKVKICIELELDLSCFQVIFWARSFIDHEELEITFQHLTMSLNKLHIRPTVSKRTTGWIYIVIKPSADKGKTDFDQEL